MPQYIIQWGGGVYTVGGKYSGGVYTVGGGGGYMLTFFVQVLSIL